MRSGISRRRLARYLFMCLLLCRLTAPAMSQQGTPLGAAQTTSPGIGMATPEMERSESQDTRCLSNPNSPICQALQRQGGISSGEEVGIPDPGSRLDQGLYEQMLWPDAYPSERSLPPEEQIERGGQIVQPGVQGVPATLPAGPMVRPSRRPPEPQEPPSPFQVFVKDATGTMLPLFGQNLFRKVPSTFAPADQTNINDEYLIGPGDELRVRIWGPMDIQARGIVDRGGNIFISRVGAVQVAGVRYKDLEEHLRKAVGQTFRNFDISATVSRLRGIQVFVTGYAQRPGAYTVSGLSTLVNALFASGGPSRSGSMRNIQVRRGGKVITQFDLYDLLLKGDTTKDIVLQPQDVIYIGPVGPLAAISGPVNVPAIYELVPNTTLGGAIALGGGLGNTADSRRATIERVEDHKERSVIQVPLDGDGLGITLKDGDLVRIFSLSSKIENAVVLRGNVANPGRFPFKPGMRISDLIPARDFLLTHQFWAAQMAVGPSNGGTQEAVAVSKSAPDINWDYAVVQRVDPTDLSGRLISFNLSRAIEKSGSDDVALQPGDIITIFSQRDLAVPMERRTKYIRLEGEFTSPGVYRVEPGETLRQVVARVGLTSNAYLFGAELRRESTRVEQQKRLDQFAEELRSSIERQASVATSPEAVVRAQAQREFVNRLSQLKATGRIVLGLTPDASDAVNLPDVNLEDGDVLNVGPRPTIVNVLGEVYNPTSFLFQTAQNVGDYVERGGGTTRNADRSRTYVVRANGDVVSLGQRGSLWRGSAFHRVRVLPGDTIIVPLRLNKGETVRAIRDWTQIISQFALGVAAIQTLTN